MYKVAFWLFLLICAFRFFPAQGDDFSFRMGMGMNQQAPTGSIKIFSLREESHLFYSIHQAVDVGGWVDNLADTSWYADHNRKDSFYGKYMLGVKPGPQVGTYAKAFVGVAGLTAKDSQLGGHFQFSQDLALGVRDKRSFVEIGYTHFSSAGIYKPNKGRDFVLFGVGVTF